MISIVKRVEQYTVNELEVLKFKNAVAHYLNEEDENENFTANDISDGIVQEILNEAIQSAYQEDDGSSGITFDEYFKTISINCTSEDVTDAVYEAAALVRDATSNTEVSKVNEKTSHFVVVNDWANPEDSGFEILYVAHSYDEAYAFYCDRLPEEKVVSEESGYEVVDEHEGYYDSWIAEGFYSNNHNKLYIQEV